MTSSTSPAGGWRIVVGVLGTSILAGAGLLLLAYWATSTGLLPPWFDVSDAAYFIIFPIALVAVLILAHGQDKWIGPPHLHLAGSRSLHWLSATALVLAMSGARSILRDHRSGGPAAPAYVLLIPAMLLVLGLMARALAWDARIHPETQARGAVGEAIGACAILCLFVWSFVSALRMDDLPAEPWLASKPALLALHVPFAFVLLYVIAWDVLTYRRLRRSGPGAPGLMDVLSKTGRDSAAD